MLPDFDDLKQQLMLPQFLNGSLENLLNGLIRRSDRCEPYLRKLNGNVLALRLERPVLQIYLFFSAQHIDLLQQYEGEPDCDCTISADLLLNPPKKSELSRHINDKSIVFNGDLEVLQNFAGLIEHLEKDPAELLSPYLGDVIAQSAVDFGHFVSNTLKQKIDQSQRHWGERLTEEYQLIAPTLATVDFCDQVKILEKQTALLQQKIDKLDNES